MKQRKLEKRIASLFLIAAMLLSYIPGTVWAVDSATDIKAIEKPTGISIVEDYDDYVGDNWLSQLGLPATVTVTLANNTKQDVPVTWDSSKLDTRTTGYYSLPGTVILPDGATNGQNLDVSIVKIDKSITQNATTENGFIILKNIINTARKIGFKTLCEGIETKRQEDAALCAGCDLLQGFYYYKPMPVADLEKLLEQNI